VNIATPRLDPASLDYLRRLEAARGEGHNGVFAWAPNRADPRDGWGLLSFLGLAALGVAGWLVRPSFLDGRDVFLVVCGQAVLAAAGALLLALGLRRRARTPLLASFLYVDALHAWEVSPRCVEVTALDGLLGVEGFHHYTQDGTHTWSELTLHLPEGSRELHVYDLATAERLARFLGLLLTLPDAEDAELRERVRSSRALLGAVAVRYADGEPIEDLRGLPEGPDLPRPAAAPVVDVKLAPGGAFRRAAPWLAAAAAGCLAMPLFSQVDRHLLDEYCWDLARRQADEEHSPSRLRAYLADAENRRHRGEAREKISVFYDEVLARLKERRANHRDPERPIDEPMFAAVLELIEALKTRDHPVVTVGFRGTQEAEPATEEEKGREKSVYDLRVRENPELAEVARKSPDGTAVLARGEAFDAAQTRRREEVILARLRDSVQRALGADILTLERARDGEEPVLQVAYHVYPTGGLYLYVSEPEGRQPEGRTAARGLIRGYVIDWTITIRPPGGRAHECRLGSQPASNLHYDSEPGDPAWAPYAVVLYSAFDDLSSRLVGNFALPPPKAPERYRFRAVTGDKDR
jgi:hypothetical protein